MTRAIASRDNPAFRRMRDLGRDARMRAAEGVAWIEGDHLLRAWLDAGRPIETCVVVGDAPPAARDCWLRAERAGARALEFAPALMRSLSVLETPAPIAAVVPQPSGRLDRLSGGDCVVLDAIQDPGNVGAMLRTAAAAGVSGVITGPGCADVWSPKVLRAAMGAHVALELVQVDDIVGALDRLALPAYATAADAPLDLFATALPQPMAWLFGHEGRGLSAGVAERADACLRIPQTARVESLNVAAAAAVCLFEMRRRRLAA